MLENSIKEITEILNSFRGVNGIEIIDTDYVRIRYQCPETDKEIIEPISTDEGEAIGVKTLEFLEGKFQTK